MEASVIQVIVASVLSSGLVGGIITLFTKRVWSPESKNELARIGNEFAQQLLEDAKNERTELRETIKQLEGSNFSKEQAIERLQKIADDKDTVIQQLEERQLVVARKLQRGEAVSLYDIFGENAPKELITLFSSEIRKGAKDERGPKS